MPDPNPDALTFLLTRRSRPAKTLTGPAPSRAELAIDFTWPGPSVHDAAFEGALPIHTPRASDKGNTGAGASWLIWFAKTST